LNKYTGISYWEEADRPSKLSEEIGETVYPCGDGTYYAVDEDAPEESHFLASGASQGDPESIKIIDGVVEIASGDDDISEDLLDWSGLDAIWKKYRLNDYELFMDLAAQADSIDITHESWGGDAPGVSGVWMTATTTDAEALKQELRDLIAKLIWENRHAIRNKNNNHE
jgi:hypothetical protein